MSETKHLFSECDQLQTEGKEIFFNNLSAQIRHGTKSTNTTNPTNRMVPQPGTVDISDPGSSSSSSSIINTAATSATKYGTMPSSSSGSSFKRTMLMDTGYPRTYFTRRQFFIAAISMSLFIAAVAVTLIFGLPRLEAKREEYFAAKFYESPVQEIVHSKFTVLVSSNEYPSCTNAGRDMLIHKGSAMDAALASLFCLAIASPHLVGLDSGFRGLIYSKRTIYSFNAREQIFHFKNASITYPILPFAAEQLHKRFGRVTWSSILTPSIWLAKNGVPISQQLACQLKEYEILLQNQFKQIRELFLHRTNITERLLKAGEIYKNPSLGSTFQLIASNGSVAIFDKNLVNGIASIINENITNEELKSFLEKIEVISLEKPLQFSLLNDNLRIFSGNQHDSNEIVTLVYMLKILEKLIFNVDPGFTLCNKYSQSLKEGALQLRYLLDTMQCGATALAKLRAQQTNTFKILDNHYIDKIVELILNITENNVKTHNYNYFNMSEQLDDYLRDISIQGHNVQIIVHDGQSGDVVVLTTSKLRTLFQGDHKLFLNTSGLVLDMFHSSELETKIKSMVQWPVLVQDDKLGHIQLVLGGISGRGPLQTLYAIFQVMAKVLFNCQTLKSSIDDSRLFYEPPDDLFYEARFPQAYIDLLVRLFEQHNLKANTVRNDWIDSGVYAVMRTPVDSNTVKAIGDSIDNQLHSMIDFRQNGFVSGL